ncbi:hypothetical protein IscW_ISCW008007 [Ixodes scapularis]|uniref:Uncharacterized protein n=1 Tax=Ixodes scapularis TaxID=6945 RepID=B7PVA7_IXOSC|nr:hypothetical protein IscW_ISCW008007 [Ixodes scapularis]|eukprot:XP_002407582.1 hypothetical protein IscW_ISCW008007 [Ixodes scapularis]
MMSLDGVAFSNSLECRLRPSLLHRKNEWHLLCFESHWVENFDFGKGEEGGERGGGVPSRRRCRLGGARSVHLGSGVRSCESRSPVECGAPRTDGYCEQETHEDIE